MCAFHIRLGLQNDFRNRTINYIKGVQSYSQTVSVAVSIPPEQQSHLV